jgi:hypothetical protein
MVCAAPLTYSQVIPPTPYTAKCASCHGTLARLVQGATAETAVVGPTLTPFTFQYDWLNNPEGIVGGVPPDGIRSRMNQTGAMPGLISTASLSVAELLEIQQYFLKVRDANYTDETSAALAATTTNATPTVRGQATSAITFPTTVAGTSASRFFVVTNWRQSALNYGAITLSGTNASEYSVSTTCAGTIAGNGGQCTFNIQFLPTGNGSRTAAFSIDLSSPVLTGVTVPATQPTPYLHTFNLSGTGQVLVPAFSISLTALPFTATVGTTSTASASISNPGTAPLALTAVTLDPTAPEYSFGPGNTCTSGASIAVGGAPCTLSIVYTPTSIGSRPGNVTITHNAAGSPATVALNGTATAAPSALVQVDSTTLSFGSRFIGQPATLPLRIVNGGQAPLVFSAPLQASGSTADYTIGGDCSPAVPVAANGGFCTAQVTFSPTALQNRPGEIQILSNASNTPAPRITLSGSGVAVPAPQLGLPFATLDFGRQSLTGVYASRPVTLSNTGSADLALTSISASSPFSIASSACPATLAAAANCVVLLRFNPTTADTDYTGTLTIVTNAANSPGIVSLTGRGVVDAVPVLSWLPVQTQLDLGQVAVGTASTQQVVALQNAGPGGVVLNLVNAIGIDRSAFAVALLNGCVVGQTLFQGQSCDVGIQFMPGSAGPKQASIQVASTGSTPPTLTLIGSGLGGASAGLAVSASTLAFAPVTAGTQSTQSEVSISNNGTGVLHVTDITTTGAFAMRSKTCASLPFDLSPGASCIVNVTFNPTAAGSTAGKLSIVSSATATPTEVQLSGSANAAASVSSGGGCSIASGDTLLDPTLWLLILAAAGVLIHRERTQRSSALRRAAEAGGAGADRDDERPA